jgi:tetratricopeptide (TPR) repeat protein
MNSAQGRPLDISANSPAISPQEKRAREWLSEGRWRKARDEFKLLCKQDHVKYLPLLIQANVGLARDMLAKGQVSEAQQVVAYLKTIAAPGDLRALEIELMGKTGNFSGQMAGLIECLARPAPPFSTVETRRLADQLVLTFQPAHSATDGDATLAEELNAIHQALQAVAAGQTARVIDLLRPLPHSSIFSHWKLFLRGLAAFHTGDFEKAARFFAELPADSIPAHARRPYLIWMDQEKTTGRDSTPSELMVEALCRLAGAPQASRPLFLAERMWRERRPQEMYRLLREGIGAFPAESPGWMQTLSTFCFHCLFILPPEKAGDYSYYLDDLDYHQCAKNPFEQAMILRALCLYDALSNDLEFLLEKWKRFIPLCEQLRGPNPRRASLAHAWLGDILSRSLGPARAPGFHRVPEMRDASGAIEAYQKSIDLDPANLEAHLKLAIIFDLMKMTPDRNRLLDQMTRRFPDSKPVLIVAGLQCVERQAYAKGLAYLERARVIDRLDPALPDVLVSAKILLARQHFRERRPEKARQILDELEELTVPESHHFLRGRWTIQLRRGLFEEWHGDAQQASSLLAEARAGSPDMAAFCLLAVIVWDLHAPRGVSTHRFEDEFCRIYQAAASAAQAILLLRVHGFWKRTSAAFALARAERLIGDFLQWIAARGRFSREDVVRLIELIPPGSPFEYELPDFIRAILKKDPQDPLFRIYHLRQDWFTGDGPAEKRRQLEQILEEAIRRRDEQAIQFTRKEMDRLKVAPPVPAGGPPFDADEFAEGPEFSEDDDLNLPESLADLPGLKQVIEVLSIASESEIRQLRKTKPKNMPDAMFDLLLDVARGKIPLPPLPPPPPLPSPVAPKGKTVQPPLRSRQPVSPPEDPNQLNLF